MDRINIGYDPQELKWLLTTEDSSVLDSLREEAVAKRQEVFQDKVYIRGLIEFTNYCKNDCYYCGIRRSNPAVARYRLNKEDILTCCHQGYDLGFRTFVLQGGEDPYYRGGRLTDIVVAIREEFPLCAITLSAGELTYDEYRDLFSAGANRYLLRHETASESHYDRLHPEAMTLANRKKCLSQLKEIGYQVGCGFMVGSPFQTVDNLVEDLMFIGELKPAMIGIGPFIPAEGTPFASEETGSAQLTLRLLSMLRLLEPKALLPATTALGTASEDGRLKGILAGANVIMPNLSPAEARARYTLYNNKIHTGAESAEGLEKLKDSVASIGYRIVVDRGDNPDFID